MSFLFGSKKEAVNLGAVDSDALIQVLKGLDLVLDDRIPEARVIFQSGSSSFHLVGEAVVTFIQGVLGFEPEVLKQAGTQFEAAELALDKGARTAQKYRLTTSTYPAGLEYEIVLGECMLMHAITGFAGETIMNSLKSVLKIKRAYAVFDKIWKQHGDKILAKHSQTSTEEHEDPTVPLVDEAIQSGTLLCYGLLTLIISLLPPKLAKVLNVLGMHGNRQNALKFLWLAASKPQSLHGAAAFASLVQYYGGAVQLCDIYSTEDGPDGWPIERANNTLQQVNAFYPKGKLWVLHDAKLKSMERKLNEALQVLDRGFQGEKPQLQQIEALMLFEYALNAAFDHRYKEAADYLIRVRDQNTWSHALYTYFAACCLLQDARANGDAASLASASALLETVPAMFLTKAKMFGGVKRVPIEALIERRIRKWSARRKATPDAGLAEFAGPNPIMELIYIYNGYRRMSPAALERWTQVTPAPDMDDDDVLCSKLMQAVVLRNLGRPNEAGTILEQDVLARKKSGTEEVWALAFGEYEYACCMYWEALPLEDAICKKQLDDCYGHLRAAVDYGDANELEGRLNIRVQLAKEVVKAKRGTV
ncbi:mitochondrial outer membrane protein C83.16c [Protomyces lactucae-debilis]|uniref:Mitochondrial outer membrane protein C83.16c n=1 Tax=Protomyces lactucae-debilis TaxID=2754530 RepID=A0A1Y2EZL3_PROLT|nr:mitochondrial outer membrane protein C83.16c [Protomyces lactucae-debilis]ORY76704.1 mitochondrial outer membrane protein C83.16c [Protomyces lactucae-debilis]